jgi:hypothetical protein
MGFAFLNFLLPDTGAKMLAIMKLAKQQTKTPAIRNKNEKEKKAE